MMGGIAEGILIVLVVLLIFGLLVPWEDD